MQEKIRAIEFFKVPKFRNKKILEEDKFLEGLEIIIKRDFFPELQKIENYYKWKNEMYDDARSKFGNILDKDSVNNDNDFDHNLEKQTLNQYLQKYTSDENKTLENIIQKDREDFCKKFAWMFDAIEYNDKKNAAVQEGNDNKLFNMVEGNTKNQLKFHKNEGTSSVFYYPQIHAGSCQTYARPDIRLGKKQIYENTRLEKYDKEKNELGLYEEDSQSRQPVSVLQHLNENLPTNYDFAENMSMSTPNVLGK